MMIRTLTFEKTINLYDDFKKFKNQYNESQLLQISDVLIENLIHYQLPQKTVKVLNYLFERYRIVLVTKCDRNEGTHKRSNESDGGYMSIREKKYFLLQRKIILSLMGNTTEGFQDVGRIFQGTSKEFNFYHMRARAFIQLGETGRLETLLKDPAFPQPAFFVGDLATLRGSGEAAIRYYSEAKSNYMVAIINFRMKRFEWSLYYFLQELFGNHDRYSRSHHIWMRIGDCFYELSKLSISIKHHHPNHQKISEIIPSLDLKETKLLLEYAIVSYNNALRFVPEHFHEIKQKILLKITHLHLRQENPLFAYQAIRKMEFEYLTDEYDRICYVEYTLESLMLLRRWKEFEIFFSSQQLQIQKPTNLLTKNRKITHRPYLIYLIHFFRGKLRWLHDVLFKSLLEQDRSYEQLKKHHNVDETTIQILKEKKLKEEEQKEEKEKETESKEEIIDGRLHLVRFLVYFLAGNARLAKDVGNESDEIRRQMYDLIEMNQNMKFVENSGFVFSSTSKML